MPPDLTAGAIRAHALLAGHLAGVAAAHGPAAGRAAFEAARVLAEEVLVPEPDLEVLARRWATLDGAGSLDPGTTRGLAFLATGHGPRSDAGAEPATLPLLIPPVALVTFDSPRNLLSASYHLAGLIHPAPESQWAAVAVNVALARFLQGYRDFVPDLIEALRNNDAPGSLLGLARRIPVLARREVEGLGVSCTPAVRDAIVALWLADREPVAARATAFLNEGGSAARSAFPAAFALLGARDAAAPAAPLALPVPDADIRALAIRLARITNS
jgi:hypothetical protein